MEKPNEKGKGGVGRGWVVFCAFASITIGLGGSLGMIAFVDFMKHAKAPRAVEEMMILGCKADKYMTANPDESMFPCGPIPGREADYGRGQDWPKDSCFSRLGYTPAQGPGIAMQILPLPERDYLIIGLQPIKGGPLVFVMRQNGIIYGLSGSNSMVYGEAKSCPDFLASGDAT